ncbi:MAG: hypothetical protein GWN00_33095 [Aliifodinibius sp.]|nr:hypothetical protein [Fodinibius sp.]NIV15593.1 hypothetical protein [Fodinibius sp.]NIY29454.1 hypothetical protein [Fodinibius sp.]
MGKGFSIPNTSYGFDLLLWQKLRQRLDEINPHTVIFAIETACNLWPFLASDVFLPLARQSFLLSPSRLAHTEASS